ncbi:Hypothetical_protein [Hexamita inflata]|uniref:Hypothetical_protein n=1 Tax=Hexamita inflata TaxID=28002 RepID=A0AA86TSS3_9EUKA|nr:Hypothetical protein HINF_LOCUS14941 [Hexamita inflata]
MNITEFILYTYVISYLIRYFCPDLGQEWEKLHLVCIFSSMHIPKRTQIFTYMHMFLRSMISKNMRMFINMRMFLTICRWSIIQLKFQLTHFFSKQDTEIFREERTLIIEP